MPLRRVSLRSAHVGVVWLERGSVSLVFSVLIGGFPGSAAELLSIGFGVTRSAG